MVSLVELELYINTVPAVPYKSLPGLLSLSLIKNIPASFSLASN